MTHKRKAPTWVRLKVAKQQVSELQIEIGQLRRERYIALQNVELYKSAYETALEGIKVRDKRIDRLIDTLDGYISEIVELRQNQAKCHRPDERSVSGEKCPLAVLRSTDHREMPPTR